MTETLTHGYSSESTQRELFNEFKQGQDGFERVLHPCALDESSLCIGRVNNNLQFIIFVKEDIGKIAV